MLLAKGYLQVWLLFMAIGFFVRADIVVQSRLLVSIGFGLAYLLEAFLRCWIVPSFYRFLVQREKVGKRVLIIGTGATATKLVRALKRESSPYFQVVGFCHDDASKVGKKIENWLVLGTIGELEALVDRYRVSELIIATDTTDHENLIDLVQRCKRSRCVIHVMSSLYKAITERLEVESFGGIQTFRIIKNVGNGIVRNTLKRVLDVVIAFLGFLLLSWLFLIIVVAIKIDSSGPLFYAKMVVGKNGARFYFYKFRSMFHEHDGSRHINFMKRFISGSTSDFYLKDDQRITRVGKYLRRFSLDELPQLWNVLKGEMSLVGPRPCATDEFEFYKKWHKARLHAKPGLTGLWQVRGRSSVSYDDMVAIDLYYIENQAFWLDLEILLRTIFVVLTGKGSRV